MFVKVLPKSFHNLGFALLLSFAVTLAGCTDQGAGSSTADEPLSPTTSLPEAADAEATAGDVAAGETVANQYHPIAVAACEALQADVEQVLGVEVTREDTAGFESAIGGFTGESCRLSATGTGENFTNFVDVATDLIAMFEAQGWIPDPQYVADGPTGTVVGVRQSNTIGDNGLAIIAVNWDPAPDVACPQDQPISACAEELEPNQMLYDITIDVVEVG